MKITIYELLGMIKDDKAPNRIIYGDTVYEWNKKMINYASEINLNITLDWDYITKFCLNDEIEILEEEKKIPEKLEYVVSDENGEFSINGFTFDYEQKMQIIDTINQVIDYLKSKG